MDGDDLRLDTILSEMSASSNKTILQYKNLSDSVFFWTALALQVTILICAMTIEDLELVFEFNGAFGCSSVTFLFPGVAYLVALSKYGRPSTHKKWSTLFYKILAWVFLIIFAALLSAFFYVEIQKAAGNLESGETSEAAAS